MCFFRSGFNEGDNDSPLNSGNPRENELGPIEFIKNQILERFPNFKKFKSLFPEIPLGSLSASLLKEIQTDVQKQLDTDTTLLYQLNEIKQTRELTSSESDTEMRIAKDREILEEKMTTIENCDSELESFLEAIHNI